ncbi:hypothetical protein KIL84_002357 [Mauremys mutica]|uniref:Uncharacterized protein n=1 Tax=Mauremys mutica TaxID=74926 RepID=A0A9D3X7B4_9SAUR|nr:hypothetical protein KIL84_002357 [Mauremys mutica]
MCRITQPGTSPTPPLLSHSRTGSLVGAGSPSSPLQPMAPRTSKLTANPCPPPLPGSWLLGPHVPHRAAECRVLAGPPQGQLGRQDQSNDELIQGEKGLRTGHSFPQESCPDSRFFSQNQILKKMVGRYFHCPANSNQPLFSHLDL